MNREDAEEYTQSLGQIVGGSWRQIALAKRLGVPQALGLTTEQWVHQRLGGYIKLAIPERREAVKELTASGDSTRDVAEIVGVSHVTVADDVKNLTAPHNHRANYTGEFEWYTPSEYIEAAREVLGSIELDPASSETAQQTVRAVKFFSATDDGLARPWYGRTWLNPPYSQPLIAQFVDKLVQEFESGRVTEAITLTHNSTDTAWFHKLAATAVRLCFTRGRIAFVDPHGERCAPTQGQAFCYFGRRPEAFERTFGAIGLVLETSARCTDMRAVAA